MEPRDLSAHVAYEAGRGHEEVAREQGVDPDDLVVLSSNENPLGPSPAAVEAVREHAAGVNRYPKAAHTDLRAAVAREWDLPPEQVWLAAGGDGALDSLHRALLHPGENVLVPDPGFAYYAMSARYHHGGVATYPLEKAEEFAQTTAILDHYGGERVVYAISPHSPTGSEIDVETARELARRTDEETLLVVDEAYAEFSASPSKVDLVRERDDVAVLRTFSKAYGLAGLRVGYLLAPDAWADAYAKVNTPFAVNELACRGALAALDDDGHVERSVDLARWGREYLREHLDARTWESGGNFVLAEVGDASAVAAACERRGVLVRDCTSFGLPDCVRITCGTREETERAVEVIDAVT
jgi:histidinol-phosphate aminotransferase